MTKEHLMGCRRSLPHQPAVEPDAIRLAHSHAELCELAVDGETPRAYPALDLAPGAEPDVGERLLQPLSGLLPHAGPRLARHGLARSWRGRDPSLRARRVLARILRV